MLSALASHGTMFLHGHVIIGPTPVAVDKALGCVSFVCLVKLSWPNTYTYLCKFDTDDQIYDSILLLMLLPNRWKYHCGMGSLGSFQKHE